MTLQRSIAHQLWGCDNVICFYDPGERRLGSSGVDERYGEAARTTVILSFNKKATAKTQQQLQEIQNKMRTGKEYKLKEICEFTGLKRTRTHDLVKKLFVSMIVAVRQDT